MSKNHILDFNKLEKITFREKRKIKRMESSLPRKILKRAKNSLFLVYNLIIGVGNMNFGNNLKNFRKNNKLSQEELAFKLGVTRQSVSKWEVGTAYPEMTNIIALCTLFNCKITDLINDTIGDYKNFNDEIKDEVVKFNNKEQKNIKIVSKAIYSLSRLIILFLIVPTFLLSIFSLVYPFISSNIKISNKNVTIYNKEYKINAIITMNNLGGFNMENKNQISSCCIETNLMFVTINSILQILFLYYLVKLFKNIYDKKIPFSLDNEKIINKIVFILLGEKVLNIIFMLIASLFLKIDNVFEFNIKDIVEILIIISILYFFKYGRLIQKDSKAVIYSEN